MSKVVLVVEEFPGASETFIVNKFLGLIRRGVDVEIACRRSDPKAWVKSKQLASEPGCRKRVRVSWPSRSWMRAFLSFPLALSTTFFANPLGSLRYLLVGWQHFGFNAFAQFYLDARIISAKPDIVHFEFGGLAANRMHIGVFLGAKTVVSFRGYDLNYLRLEAPDYYADVWKFADGIHCLGQDLWRRARRRGCPPGKRTVLIPPAIDTDLFRPLPARDGDAVSAGQRPLRLLSVGRLEWKKGHEYALMSAKILRERGLEFEYRIVGAGRYLDAVAFCRHELGLDDCVSLVGLASPSEVREEMERADIFLHAAVSEGFCNTVLEAQAMELGVVCTDADGLPENVEDGVTGFVVARRDPNAMAEATWTLAHNPNLRKAMGKSARQRVLNHFRLEDQITDFANFYSDVINDRGGDSAATPIAQ